MMVEQGSAPLESASFWLTIARIRPLEGSIASAVPFRLPSPWMAAARTTGSSPAVESPRVTSSLKELAVKRSTRRRPRCATACSACVTPAELRRAAADIRMPVLEAREREAVVEALAEVCVAIGELGAAVPKAVLDAAVLVAVALDALALDAVVLDAMALDAVALDAAVLEAALLVAVIAGLTGLRATVLDAVALWAVAFGGLAFDAAAFEIGRASCRERV